MSKSKTNVTSRFVVAKVSGLKLLGYVKKTSSLTLAEPKLTDMLFDNGVVLFENVTDAQIFIGLNAKHHDEQFNGEFAILEIDTSPQPYKFDWVTPHEWQINRTYSIITAVFNRMKYILSVDTDETSSRSWSISTGYENGITWKKITPILSDYQVGVIFDSPTDAYVFIHDKINKNERMRDKLITSKGLDSVQIETFTIKEVARTII